MRWQFPLLGVGAAVRGDALVLVVLPLEVHLREVHGRTLRAKAGRSRHARQGHRHYVDESRDKVVVFTGNTDEDESCDEITRILSSKKTLRTVTQAQHATLAQYRA